MALLAGLCMLFFVVAMSAVGLGLLWRARRTRGTPELLLGAGFAIIGLLGYPLGIAARPGGTVGDMNLPVFVAGIVCSYLGMSAFYAFTWRVFRPGALGAAITACGIGGMVGAGALNAHGILTAPASMPAVQAGGAWALVAMLFTTACFLWTAFEAFAEWARARRRLALGLADPVVVSRILMWGVYASSGVLLCGVYAVLQARGVPPTGSALGQDFAGLAALVSTTAMLLAFFPPRAWQERLRRGHPTPS